MIFGAKQIELELLSVGELRSRKIDAVQLPHLAAGKSLNALISESNALTSGSNIKSAA